MRLALILALLLTGCASHHRLEMIHVVEATKHLPRR